MCQIILANPTTIYGQLLYRHYLIVSFTFCITMLPLCIIAIIIPRQEFYVTLVIDVLLIFQGSRIFDGIFVRAWVPRRPTDLVYAIYFRFSSIRFSHALSQIYYFY